MLRVSIIRASMGLGSYKGAQYSQQALKLIENWRLESAGFIEYIDQPVADGTCLLWVTKQGKLVWVSSRGNNELE
ncbi:hypothetical protein TUM17387_31080 [Shewanella carassii]|nr:hypothetical protein TUM17387_31080 [Shewanella carassii]